MVQDLRYGVRMMLALPGFTVGAVLMLALGIGANTAIFTLLDKLLIRALPLERPAELVRLVRDGAGAPIAFSYPVGHVFGDCRVVKRTGQVGAAVR